MCMESILEGNLEVGLVNHAAIRQNQPPSPNFDGSKACRTKKTLNEQISLTNQVHKSSFTPLFVATPGTFCGLSFCFTRSNLFTVRSPEDAEDSVMLLKLDAGTLESVISRHPRVLIRCLLDIYDTIGDSGM